MTTGRINRGLKTVCVSTPLLSYRPFEACSCPLTLNNVNAVAFASTTGANSSPSSSPLDFRVCTSATNFCLSTLEIACRIGYISEELPQHCSSCVCRFLLQKCRVLGQLIMNIEVARWRVITTSKRSASYLLKSFASLFSRHSQPWPQISRWRLLWKQCCRRDFPANSRQQHLWKQCWRREFPANSRRRHLWKQCWR